jgi:hypothetical protein
MLAYPISDARLCIDVVVCMSIDFYFESTE